jgi:squalene cyclase
VAKVPKSHRWVFWDVDAAALDTARDADYILPRVLEFGRLVEVRWAIATYGMEGIHRFLRDVGHTELSDRTLRFWRAVLKAKDETWASPPASRKSSGAPWID